MRYSTFIVVLFHCFSFCTGQVNHNKAFKLVLQRNKIGKEYSFDQSKVGDMDSLVLKYLGQIATSKGRVLKVMTSRWYWGLAPRATSRIIIFNERDQYLGDYYLTMTYDVPDRIENGYLVFENAIQNKLCEPGLLTKVSFQNGIPKQFFVKCKNNMGDIYYFEQNL